MRVKLKTCWKCGDPKPLSEFNKHAGRKDGRQTKCRACSSEISKQYFQRVGHGQRDHTVRRNDLADRVMAYLSKHSCVDCPESDPVVLEFDHVRGKKKADVSRLISARYGWATIAAEIAKCEVVCANCHRRRTYRRRGCRRWKLAA